MLYTAAILFSFTVNNFTNASDSNSKNYQNKLKLCMQKANKGGKLGDAASLYCQKILGDEINNESLKNKGKITFKPTPDPEMLNLNKEKSKYKIKLYKEIQIQF